MDGFSFYGLLVAAVLFVITLVMIPVQYRYIHSMEEEREKKKHEHGEVYDKMPLGEEFLHMNSQINPLFLPANLIAYLIYKAKHKRK
ncbi:DUF3949 domain-containing protein [Bacillus haikouensis]|uniref:DUF3949 domain-containing protein n=1 Tax=Bacillus haikouensis TaxID=1510468 RepID=UPI0015558315|nr:DUF3949 domain-containing protein [Bacillus haikouensis]NQD68033.1 DUF3949 domain-containing protein [Bacillus haikouensis]